MSEVENTTEETTTEEKPRRQFHFMRASIGMATGNLIFQFLLGFFTLLIIAFEVGPMGQFLKYTKKYQPKEGLHEIFLNNIGLFEEMESASLFFAGAILAPFAGIFMGFIAGFISGKWGLIVGALSGLFAAFFKYIKTEQVDTVANIALYVFLLCLTSAIGGLIGENAVKKIIEADERKAKEANIVQ